MLGGKGSFRRHERRGKSKINVFRFLCCVFGSLFAFYLIALYSFFNKSEETKEEIVQSFEHEVEKALLQRGGNLRGPDQERIESPKFTVEIPKSSVRSSTDGVIVLGMHRSGTSMLTGLLSKSGFYVGKSNELIGAHFDNEKGFFEMIDVVLEDDELMKKQGLWWASPNLEKYNPTLALRHVIKGEVDFVKGERGLSRLNNPIHIPWILKDPRLCITFKTWLPFFNKIPAILFTYRHPVEVARSLKKREGFGLKRWFELWTTYNRLAIGSSNDLCRVVGSHLRLAQDPLNESNRMLKELRDRCGVPIPHLLAEDLIEEFVDSKLQHQKAVSKGDRSSQSSECGPEPWTAESDQPDKQGEIVAYRQAMQLYCAMESGDAFFDPKWTIQQ